MPFIFVSGAIGDERAIEALRNGATDYVLKDRLSRLGPAVRHALAEAEERRMRRRAEAGLQEALAELWAARDSLEARVVERTAELEEAAARLRQANDRLAGHARAGPFSLSNTSCAARRSRRTIRCAC